MEWRPVRPSCFNGVAVDTAQHNEHVNELKGGYMNTDIVVALGAWLFLAYVVETVAETLKNVLPLEKWFFKENGNKEKFLLAMIIGIVVALSAKANLFDVIPNIKDLGLNIWVERALTGLTIGRGSSAIHDIQNWMQNKGKINGNGK